MCLKGLNPSSGSALHSLSLSSILDGNFFPLPSANCDSLIELITLDIFSGSQQCPVLNSPPFPSKSK